MSTSKFAAFNRTDVVYKTVNDHPLLASIHIPKTPLAKGNKRPLLVHWHGGGYIVGDRNFEPWFATWIAQLAELKGAIIINPDYRLLPEAKGVEMLEDVKDFWSWVTNSLQTTLSSISSNTVVDLDKIAVTGESAGGYLSIQSAFIAPEIGIKLIMTQYGSVDLKIPHFLDPAEHRIMGAPSVPAEQYAVFIKSYMESTKPGVFRTSEDPTSAVGPRLLHAVMQQRQIPEFLGPEPEVYPMERLDQSSKFPAIWMTHGKNDTIVAMESSVNFYDKLRDVHPNSPKLLTLEPGEHGFDVNMTIDELWVQNGLKFVTERWV